MRKHRKLQKQQLSRTMTRKTSDVYGVKKSPNMPSDSSVINDILYPQLQAKYSVENPLFKFQDIFTQYGLNAIYDAFEPATVPGPFYLYLKDIFLFLNYFTREESLTSLNIALQKVVDFMENPKTKEDVANVLKNVKLINEYAGAESEIFQVAMNLQQLRSLYKGLGMTDAVTSIRYKDVVSNADIANKRIQSQDAFQRLKQISTLLDEKILTVNNVNNIDTDDLLSGIDANVPDFAPLSTNIKREIRSLERRGVSADKMAELVNYIATYDVKKQTSKIKP